MFSGMALFISGIVIVWLFARDRGIRPMASSGLWITLVWFTIIGSRPFSYWFGGGGDDSPDALLEGNPLDRNILIALILVGTIVVLRRCPEWYRVFRGKIWFPVFFVYCCISIMWSDFPLVSFKRWIREFGNVIMILILLTEKDPVMAIRAVLARYAYLVVPLSMVFIWYFPDIGTYYSRDLSEVGYCGVTTHKNELGSAMFICGMFLTWELLYMREEKQRKSGMADMVVLILLLSMVAWLVLFSHSSTALLCLILGLSILFIMKVSFIKRQASYLGTYLLVIAPLVVVLFSVHGILESITGMVGKDLTMTGRTDLWADVLMEPINPLLGTGYQSFWLGSRADYLWDRYLFHPRQAHNGYIETYLNGGLIGLGLLVTMMMSIGNVLKKELEGDNSMGILLFSFWVTALFYNCTEARFSGPYLIWIILALAALYQPPKCEPMMGAVTLTAKACTDRNL